MVITHHGTPRTPFGSYSVRRFLQRPPKNCLSISRTSFSGIRENLTIGPTANLFCSCSPKIFVEKRK
jgi:hypothetical protein